MTGTKMTARTYFAPALLTLVLLMGGASAKAQTYTAAQLQETYSAYLATEGFRPEVTSGGNVRFRREGRTYAIMVEEKDPTFFRLVLSFSSEDKTAAMRARRLEACNVASADTKVVKAYLDNDGDPTFSAEMFLVVPGDFKTMLSRVLRAIDSSYEKYTKKMG